MRRQIESTTEILTSKVTGQRYEITITKDSSKKLYKYRGTMKLGEKYLSCSKDVSFWGSVVWRKGAYRIIKAFERLYERAITD